MQQKLTLRMDDRVIKQAKYSARNHKLSLSQIVSEYFKFIASPENKCTAISAL